MTISTTQSQVTVLGNGVTTTFSFPFVYDSASAITVSYTDAAGTTTILASSQYTLFLNAPAANALWGAGGTVTYAPSGVPIANGTSLTIARTLPLTQTTSISNQGDFYPTVVEEALDTNCMQTQQVAARTGRLTGVWISGYMYDYSDVVQDGVNGNNTGNYYMCAIANTSTTWAADLAAGDWVVAINVQVINTDAQTASAAAISATASAATASAASASASTSASTSSTDATNAGISAAAAATSAGNAATSETNSAASAASAAASAINAYGSRFGTSATSNSIGTGAKTYTTQAGLGILSGAFIVASDAMSPANYNHGQVTSYNTSTGSLVINVLDTGGTGTITSWNISPSGPAGASGAGSGTVNAGTAAQLAYYAGSGTTVSGNVNATIANGDLTLGQAGSVVGKVILSNAASGTTTILPAGTGGGTITMPSGTGTLLSSSSTNTLSNKTITASSNVLGGVTTGFGSDATGDIYYRNAGGILTRLPIGGANTVLHGGTTPAYSAVVEANITLADNTTNNATAGAHGFLPKLSGNSDDVLKGDGTFGPVSGGLVASGYVTLSGTAPTKIAGVNFATVTYGGTQGLYTITFTTPLSSSNPIIVISGGATTFFWLAIITSRSSAGFIIQGGNAANGLAASPTYFDFSVYV